MIWKKSYCEKGNIPTCWCNCLFIWQLFRSAICCTIFYFLQSLNLTLSYCCLKTKQVRGVFLYILKISIISSQELFTNAQVRFHKSLSPSHQCASPSPVTSPENRDSSTPSLLQASFFFFSFNFQLTIIQLGSECPNASECCSNLAEQMLCRHWWTSAAAAGTLLSLCVKVRTKC